MTALAAVICLAGLSWMAGLLAAALREQTWPPVPAGRPRRSTWRQVWQETPR